MPVCKKVNSGVAPPRSASQSEASHELQWKICSLRLWLDKIKASAISEEKVAINIIERKRFIFLRREIEHCNDLVSKLCLLTDRSSTVLRSLYNIHRIVHKVARILKVSQHLPPPIVMQGRFLPPPGKLRRFLSRVYKRCSLTRRNATIQNEEETKSNNHETLLAIIREKRAPEKPNRMLYSHRDILARLKDSHGSRIYTKCLLNACQLSDVQEDDLLEQNDQSTCSFGPCNSTELVLSEQRSSHELLSVKESSCERGSASEEVICKLETVADTSSGGNNAGESSGPDPSLARSSRTTLPPLQTSSRSTVSNGTVSRHLRPGCHELDARGSTSALPPLRVSPVLPPLKVSPRSTAKQSIVTTLSDSQTRGTSEADSEPIGSPIRVAPQCSSHELLTVEMTCGNDTASDTVMSQLEITPTNTTPDCQDTVSAETGPKPMRSPRTTALPPLKISPRSTGKPSIPAVNEVETDIASKLETLVGLEAPYALPPMKASKAFTNDGNDTTSDPINPDAQSENALQKAVDGSMAASPSDDLSSQMSPVHICHCSVSEVSSRLDTPKKSIFVRAWSRLRGFFCIKKVGPL